MYNFATKKLYTLHWMKPTITLTCLKENNLFVWFMRKGYTAQCSELCVPTLFLLFRSRSPSHSSLKRRMLIHLNSAGAFCVRWDVAACLTCLRPSESTLFPPTHKIIPPTQTHTQRSERAFCMRELKRCYSLATLARIKLWHDIHLFARQSTMWSSSAHVDHHAFHHQPKRISKAI